MLKFSKIYIAGHTGLLGTALNKILSKKGYSNLIIKSHDDLELKDSYAVKEFFQAEKPQIVFLAAGMTGNLNYCKNNAAFLYHENSMIQNNVFAAAKQSGVEHLVYYGSSCSYPGKAKQPINEESLMCGPLEELTEAYGVAKLGGILACKAYNDQDNDINKFIAIVPNTIYGPKDHFDLNRSHVFSSLIKKFHMAVKNGMNQITLWGSGRPRREFIYSEDVAEASIFMVENANKLENTHYNLGTGIDVSIKELSLLVAKETGFNGKITWDKTKPDGQLRKFFDCSKIKQLGWVPSIPLEKGLRLTYDWYLRNIDKCK